ncbi:TPA: hypothetical protein N0F65_010941 [Lagenidium giganteum]|uniref:Calmodulin n=1 Tax=Lagenidium giganteum TaxID=4803 RepID=A0AAV2YYE2_9STRA|nr:TPA: hypothetical protein N0F65_010941 [Lagenidium giganteum]
MVLTPKLHDDSGRMFLWFRTAHKEEGKPAIANIRYAPSSRDTDLVTKGFTCLQQDLNRNGVFGKHKFIWVSYVQSTIASTSEIIDLSLTRGELSDKTDAKLWLPLHRGFKLVPGNLNEKNAKIGVFLWLRRRRLTQSHDLVEPHIDITIESPRARAQAASHVDALENHVRKTLRRKCPVDQDGALNFGRLFDEFDVKKTRAVARQAVFVGIEAFGIKIGKKDFALLWNRISPSGKTVIDVELFSQFLELTDLEIDEMVTVLQRSMTTQGQQHNPNYRLIFQSYNLLGDGRLSRSDFQRLFATNQMNFTNAELGKVLQRFDVNGDGVVDYADFLRYVTGVCDASARTAARVADAADELRAWAIECANTSQLCMPVRREILRWCDGIFLRCPVSL